MRATPTATWNSGGTVDDGSASSSITSLYTFNGSKTGGYIGFNISPSLTLGRGCAIYNVNISFDSEL